MNYRRYILALGGLILVILVVIATVSLGKQNTSPRPSAPAPLTSHDTDGSEVRLIFESPVEADELHHTTTIAVSANTRSIETDKTYLNQMVAIQTYGNDQPAFNDFLQALQYANFTKSASKAAASSEVGVCPEGERYVYELVTGGQVVTRLWSSSCSIQGTFNGDASLIHTLFEAQIPDFSVYEQKAQAVLNPSLATGETNQ